TGARSCAPPWSPWWARVSPGSRAVSSNPRWCTRGTGRRSGRWWGCSTSCWCCGSLCGRPSGGPAPTLSSRMSGSSTGPQAPTVAASTSPSRVSAPCGSGTPSVTAPCGPGPSSSNRATCRPWRSTTSPMSPGSTPRSTRSCCGCRRPRRPGPRPRPRAFAGDCPDGCAERETMAGVNDQSRIARNPLAAPVVAMIGGGQLARMTHQSAVALGQTLRVLAADPVDPAAQVTPDVVIGAHDDPGSVRRVAAGADVVTFDHEHVPPQLLRELEDAGVAVRPRSSALIHAQDKLVMRRALAEIGAPVPPFTGIDTLEDVRRFHAEQDGAIVLKSARGGYDGRGVWMPDSLAEAERIAGEQLSAEVPMLAEARVPWVRELSAMVARSPFGQGAVWPVVETVQRDGICAVAVAPATGLDDELRSAVQATALRLAEHLDVTGVMAVELFEVIGADGRPGVLVNELAMRPHNSGHWTMDGAVTSQFEQHLRAVLDYPLGSTVAIAPVTVMANVLG